MSCILHRNFIAEDKLISSFLDEMGRTGIYPIDPSVIKADGEIHRFRDRDDKPNTLNGWGVLFPETLSGAFGNWRKIISHKFKLRDCYQTSVGMQHAYRNKVSQSKQANFEKRLNRQRLAAQRANEIWHKALSPNINHPYLKKKMIRSFVARQKDSCLVLPVLDFDHQLHSLQFINEQGNKRLLEGGVKKGNFIPIQIQPDSGSIYVCEGFATGATIAEEVPNATVLAAIDAGNLKSVAVKARMYFPSTNLFICADDDRLTDGNPGLTKAHEAAIYSGAQLITPTWPNGSPGGLSDFNDLACWHKSQRGVAA